MKYPTSKNDFSIVNIIIIVLLSIIFLRTCSLSTSEVDKKIDAVSIKIDSLPTHKDLEIEGLKNEKRMIQSTDRKILDVNRQNEIDKELQILEKTK
jgi:hypothetical protein